MIIDLKGFFRNKDSKLNIDYSFSLENEVIDGVKPFVSPILVKGDILGKSAAPELMLELNYDFLVPCNRCMEDSLAHVNLKVHHALVKEDMDDDDDFYVKVGDTLDLDELLYQEIILNLPVKIICNDNCRGICPTCGANLNLKNCNCDIGEPDSRFASLKDLLQNN